MESSIWISPSVEDGDQLVFAPVSLRSFAVKWPSLTDPRFMYGAGLASVYLLIWKAGSNPFGFLSSPRFVIKNCGTTVGNFLNGTERVRGT